jgi:hypothetical protein
VRPYKINKIDLSTDYPCPCRRRGRLQPIILTEALGCDRCQQIFVVKENGHVIEKLSSIYHKQAWRWTGYRWANVYSGIKQTYLSVIIVTFMMLPIVAVVAIPFILRLSSAQSLLFWATVLALMTILLALMIWLANRR